MQLAEFIVWVCLAVLVILSLQGIIHTIETKEITSCQIEQHDIRL